jgi:aminodeoxyfutalosine deaminase
MSSAFHRSRWVMVEPDVWLEDAVVEVFQRRIESVERYSGQGPVVDHGPGVIMPALVNAHTHLSLCALAARIDPSRGFVPWVRDLIRIREETAPEMVSTSAEHAAGAVKSYGTGMVAEVGPFFPGAGALQAAGLEGIVFGEILGSDPRLPVLPDDQEGLCFSYAGHALHTTAAGVLRSLKGVTMARNKPFSLHLAESEAEDEFLGSGRGQWAELLDSRGIDYSSWGPWGERPVARVQRLGLLGPGTVAVHALRVTQREMAVLASSGTSVCVCPRSNLALHGELPDIEAMWEHGLAPALGTDSLASVPSLSLFDEMAFVASHYSGLHPGDILAMATVHGGLALGRADLGSLGVGSPAKLLYAALTANSSDEAAWKLVSNQFDRLEWL